jgi:hypothetical protein
MKPEYHEGPEALKKFENTMTALFRAKKTATKQTTKPVAKRKKASKG